MLKRTITLLGLTITVGALLLTLGCGGSNNVAPTGTSLAPSRGGSSPSAPMVSLGVNIWGDKFVLFRATDLEGDQLKYRVIFRNGASEIVYDQTQDSQGFNKPVYASGEWGSFKIPQSLPSGFYTVYAQAFDGTSWGPTNNPPRYLIK